MICEKKDCVGCGICESVCPENCVKMIEADDGFFYPEIESDRCVKCFKCRMYCPANIKPVSIIPNYVCAAVNKNESVRSKSASGGVFPALAEKVISTGGICFACKLNVDMTAVHDSFDAAERIPEFQDSKYVQSDMRNILPAILDELNTGRTILFTGCPCQVAGIKNYFKDYSNLICADLICNGTPSPLIFRIYIRELETRYRKKIKSFYFRNKTEGWRKSVIKIVFYDGSSTIIRRRDSSFFKLFSVLRDCCYQCRFKKFNIFSDITMGDFWGIETVHPNFDDDKGCSLVLVNSDAGKSIFSSVGDLLIHKPVSLDDAVRTHPKLIHSFPRNPYKELVFRTISENIKDPYALCKAARRMKYADIGVRIFRRLFRKSVKH